MPPSYMGRFACKCYDIKYTYDITKLLVMLNAVLQFQRVNVYSTYNKDQ